MTNDPWVAIVDYRKFLGCNSRLQKVSVIYRIATHGSFVEHTHTRTHLISSPTANVSLHMRIITSLSHAAETRGGTWRAICYWRTETKGQTTLWSSHCLLHDLREGDPVLVKPGKPGASWIPQCVENASKHRPYTLSTPRAVTRCNRQHICLSPTANEHRNLQEDAHTETTNLLLLQLRSKHTPQGSVLKHPLVLLGLYGSNYSF